ncbi:MAG: cell division protein FtsA [Lentisphaeria bacterium]|nr:cell division protein FtsA [Lentisphaeria bacterium]
MFRNRAIVGAVEFGSSGICVLLGESLPDGSLSVIGKGEAPATGIVKGEIDSLDTVFDHLGKALNDADIMSGGELNNCSILMVPISGCDIKSCPGKGAVTIDSPDGRVTEADRARAHNNARVCRLENGRVLLNSSESFFVIDDELRRRDPIGQSADKLEARVHIVHGIANRMENFRQILHNSGFEERIELVFSPMAAAEGVLVQEERENGVLLLDLGAGVTNYQLEFNRGVLASGQIQVGMMHVVNDLALGLELSQDLCHKMITNGTITAAIRDKKEFIDVPATYGKVRRIPTASFETIIDLRLRELLEIIRSAIDPETLGLVNSGVVLTGGGALFPTAQKIVREVFHSTVRVGRPSDAVGAVTDLADPRYSAVWGALKIADFYLRRDSGCNDGALQKFLNVGDSFRRMFQQVGDGLRDSFKI